jgi:hypothetical protein
LTKKKSDRRSRASAGKNRQPRADEPRGDGGPDEAAAFIAETAADLARWRSGIGWRCSAIS